MREGSSASSDAATVEMIRPLRIGGVRLPSNLILSPMSGITNMAFRRLIRRVNGSAVGLVVSEFISIEGLSRNSLRSHQMMEFHEEERPVSIQVFGAEPEKMRIAAEIVQEKGADIFDINCGCPVPKVVKKGGGAQLMRQIDRLQRILRAVRPVLSIPMTVKIRAGWDQNSRNAVEVAQLVEAEGGAMVAVHGRTRVAGYMGEADWELIACVKESVGIPVVGSGDVRSAEDARRRFLQSGVDGIMIGRGALQNPWIFREIATTLRGGAPPAPTPEAQRRLLLEYAALLREILPEKAMTGKMKQIVAQITKGMRGGARLRASVMAAGTLEEIFERIDAFVPPEGGEGKREAAGGGHPR
ncbi:MAG: tRNA dihydrouridine synthase DusB [Deltaproteobacteria bacterium]|nr:MAG: tRNA dihydrouridine synthase DusB [Deltaproteobacteria bacterium]